MNHADKLPTRRGYALKALVVDDEADARAEMTSMLSQIDNVTVVAEAADVHEAVDKLKTFFIDVIFLDVNMPGLTGLAFARALQKLQSPPAIVFASAHSEYAIDAFDVQAIDYVVKPIRMNRLIQAVRRVESHFSLHMAHKKPERIPVEHNGKKLFVSIDDIRFAVACNDYAFVQTEADRYFVLSSLARLEKNLSKYGFYRVHRSFLVNLDQVREIEPKTRGALSLTLDGVSDRIPVSRRRAATVKRALGI